MNKNLVLFILLFFVIKTVFPQEVGLVLSGGGAKGLAHIGVIKALEENDIPIDYITGTSMGAIVGSMYAAGYTVEEMIEIVTSDDFYKWANGTIDDQYSYFYKKPDLNSAMINLDFGFDSTSNSGTFLPNSLIETHVMDFEFMRNYAQANAACNGKFDSLMVPFRCVTSDIYNKQPIILSEGDLATSVRASMTFPLVFKPIKINDIVCFDGGITNNFPWDVMLMTYNPGFIIGSKTASNSERPTVDNVLLQLENMVAAQSDFDLPESIGVLIDNNYESIELLDFQKADIIINKGYVNTLAQIDDIKKRVKRRVSKKEVMVKRHEFRKKWPDLTFRTIIVEGVDLKKDAYIKNSITNRRDSVSIQKLRDKYYELVADEHIKSIYPVAVYRNKRDKFDLELDVIRNKKFTAEIGGNISSSGHNQGYAGFEYRTLSWFSGKTRGNVYYGKYYTSAEVEEILDFSWQIPVNLKLRLGLNRFDYFNSSSGSFFPDFPPSYIVDYEKFVDVKLSFPVTSNGVIRVSYSKGKRTYDYYQDNNYLKNDTVDVTKLNFSSLGLGFEKRTYNYKQFPYSGRHQLLEVKYNFGNEAFDPGSNSLINNEITQKHKYYSIYLKNEFYHNFLRYYKIGFLLEGYLNTSKDLTNYTATKILSQRFTPDHLSSTQFLENYRHKKYISCGIKNVFLLSDRFQIRLGGFVLVPYDEHIIENNIMTKKNGFDRYYYSYNAGFVYQTPFGPISLFYHHYQQNIKQDFYQFNFGYLLYNSRAY